MMSIERASARTGESCFGRCAEALDEAERVAGERAGGPDERDIAAIARYEREMQSHRPTTAGNWQWLAKRLARALENGWSRECIGPLLKLAGAA